MTKPTGDSITQQLKEYYQSSTRYRDDLQTHDESFLEPFLILVDRYLKPGSRLLDLGCGTGLSTRLLRNRGYETFGLDLSPLFLSVEKKNHGETPLLAGNALQLPFPDATFDAVVAFEFIEHVPDVPCLLDEILRVIPGGGFILFHSPNLVSPYLPAYDFLRLCLGKKGRPVFAETKSQALQWLIQNLTLSWIKKLSFHPRFVYRAPDLSERQIGGDADSVYLANPMDIATYLKARHCAIDNRSHAMSWKNKCLAALTPNFAPYMGLVAHKLPNVK